MALAVLSLLDELEIPDERLVHEREVFRALARKVGGREQERQRPDETVAHL